MDYRDGAKIIKNGGVGVIPTDTLYGIVGSAFSREAVERIYKLKGRDSKKPLIVLISAFRDLKKFGVAVSRKNKKLIEKEYWPGPVSIILPCENEEFSYIHRGTGGIAFRLPAKKELLNFLKKTGPLVAPSANPEGHSPAYNIESAREYFGGNVDFYIDGGQLGSSPSRLISLDDGKEEALR